MSPQKSANLPLRTRPVVKRQRRVLYQPGQISSGPPQVAGESADMPLQTRLVVGANGASYTNLGQSRASRSVSPEKSADLHIRPQLLVKRQRRVLYQPGPIGPGIRTKKRTSAESAFYFAPCYDNGLSASRLMGRSCDNPKPNLPRLKQLRIRTTSALSYKTRVISQT